MGTVFVGTKELPPLTGEFYIGTVVVRTAELELEKVTLEQLSSEQRD